MTKGLGKSLVLFPAVDLIDAMCRRMQKEPYPAILCFLFYVIYLYLVHFSVFFSDRKSFSSFLYVIIYCVGAGKTILMSISDGLDPYIFLSMREELNGKVYISRSCRPFLFVDIIIKLLFSTLYLDVTCNQ